MKTFFWWSISPFLVLLVLCCIVIGAGLELGRMVKGGLRSAQVYLHQE